MRTLIVLQQDYWSHAYVVAQRGWKDVKRLAYGRLRPVTTVSRGG